LFRLLPLMYLNLLVYLACFEIGFVMQCFVSSPIQIRWDTKLISAQALFGSGDSGRERPMSPSISTQAPHTPGFLRRPRTLYAQLALILVVGLAIAQAASFWLTVTERDQSMTNVMTGYVEREVTSSVALMACEPV
jgi:hypothetical protein